MPCSGIRCLSIRLAVVRPGNTKAPRYVGAAFCCRLETAGAWRVELRKAHQGFIEMPPQALKNMVPNPESNSGLKASFLKGFFALGVLVVYLNVYLNPKVPQPGTFARASAGAF